MAVRAAREFGKAGGGGFSRQTRAVALSDQGRLPVEQFFLLVQAPRQVSGDIERAGVRVRFGDARGNLANRLAEAADIRLHAADPRGQRRGGLMFLVDIV